MDVKKGLIASSGVLFYVTGGSVSLGGGGNVSLSPLSPNWEVTKDSAPAPMPEVVLWIAKSDSGATLTMGGNGNATTIQGAVYAPSAAVTLNGGGNSGGVSTQSMDVGSVAACNGGGAVPWNVVVGSPQTSGTFVLANPNAPNVSQAVTAQVTVLGIGAQTPTGTVTVYLCGPETVVYGCTKADPTAQNLGSPTVSGGNGSATATATFTPMTPGKTYCFAAYYAGDINYQASSDTSTDGCFTVSNAVPPPAAPVVSYPAVGACYHSNNGNSGGCSHWSGTITGTASDPGGPGIQNVQVAIEDANGKWWDGSGFNSATAVGQAASGTASWSYAFPIGDFPNKDTGQYNVVVTATDTLSNSGPSTLVSFIWNG
jgi:hypothetical protein